MPPSSDLIPTSDFSGKRIRSYSAAAVEHLLSLSLVVVTRNRRGRIVFCQFRSSDGANPLRSSCHMGQTYSVIENVGESGARAWRHRSLIQKQDIEALTGVPLDSPEDIDLYLRSLFRGVALSVMSAPAPAADPTKVVSIARRKQGSARPVEYDSEGRLAA